MTKGEMMMPACALSDINTPSVTVFSVRESILFTSSWGGTTMQREQRCTRNLGSWCFRKLSIYWNLSNRAKVLLAVEFTFHTHVKVAVFFFNHLSWNGRASVFGLEPLALQDLKQQTHDPTKIARCDCVRSTSRWHNCCGVHGASLRQWAAFGLALFRDI